jgi:peptidoglycan/xylan/chitin deacetylase (PgdA/CDA1 family)
MKAVMYHYVRPAHTAPPHFRYLPLDGFRRQLDHFEAGAGIASEADFVSALESGEPGPDSVVLTFDDGLRDHYEHVLPELQARGHWAIFFVPTLPHREGRVLDVHKVHLALGRAGGVRVLRELERCISPAMLDEEFVARLTGQLYRGHVEDEASAEVKRLLNYYLRLEYRAQVTATVFERTGGNEVRDAALHYASPGELRVMRAAGMTIGAHSVTHRLLSQLSEAEQRREIEDSVASVGALLGEGPATGFCFPYGGGHSFDPVTLRLLQAAGVDYCFSVEPRDISRQDLLERRFALPRYDCNAFPHGTSRVGPDSAAVSRTQPA